MICLGELFDTIIEPQTLRSAIGLQGAGGYSEQCGLVEGSLMFIGIYLSNLNKTDSYIATICYNFASSFNDIFGSLRCSELRPHGFSKNDPPHMCEKLAYNGTNFAYNYILSLNK